MGIFILDGVYLYSALKFELFVPGRERRALPEFIRENRCYPRRYNCQRCEGREPENHIGVIFFAVQVQAAAKATSSHPSCDRSPGFDYQREASPQTPPSRASVRRHEAAVQVNNMRTTSKFGFIFHEVIIIRICMRYVPKNNTFCSFFASGIRFIADAVLQFDASTCVVVTQGSVT